jgi:hypothetical protein
LVFISGRYSAAEIARDDALLSPFELLSAQVRRWAKWVRRAHHVDGINTIAETVSAAAATNGGRA